MEKMIRETVSKVPFTSVAVVDPLAPRHAEELRGKSELSPNLAGTRIGLSGLRRGETAYCDSHRAKIALQFQLLLSALSGVRQSRKPRQRLFELRLGLSH